MKKAIIICLFFSILNLAGGTGPEKKISRFDFTGPQ